MKLILEPTVDLVAHTTLRRASLAVHLESLGVSTEAMDSMFIESNDGQLLIEAAGRACYQSWRNRRPGGNPAYIERILEQGHGSVLEHVSVTFALAGISRTLSHELVRHRAGFGFSELSQRYVDCVDVNFVVPVELLPYYASYQKLDPENVAASMARARLFQVWQDSVEQARLVYGSLIANLYEQPEFQEADKTSQRKRVRQLARSVLPGCAETRMFVTANLRAWRHFTELRGAAPAEAEIRRLALAIHEALKINYRHIFGDGEAADGVLHTKYSKV